MTNTYQKKNKTKTYTNKQEKHRNIIYKLELLQIKYKRIIITIIIL